MTWICPHCDRRYPDSGIGVPRDADADRKDGCMVCFVSPVGTATFEPPGNESGIERCQACGYSKERHPMDFPEAPTCDEFQPK